MSLFSALVKVAVETIKLPVAVVKDVVTLGGAATEHESYIKEKLDDIKKASEG